MKKKAYQLFMLLMLCLIFESKGQISRMEYSEEFMQADALFNWSELYLEDSKTTKDSAISFVQNLDLRIENFTVPFLINQFGKYFYKKNKKNLIVDLSRQLEIDNYYFHNIDTQPECINIPYTLDSLNKLSNASVYSQIWDERQEFIINKFTESCVIPNSDLSFNINKLAISIDSSSKEKIVLNLNEIYSDINNTSNTKLRIELLFCLLKKTYCLGLRYEDLNHVASNISRLVDSKELTNLEKATWLVGCAKLLQTNNELRKTGVFTYQLLNKAEGLLFLNPSKHIYYLRRLSTIKALFLNRWDGLVSRKVALDILVPEAQIYRYKKFNEFEYLKRLLNCAYIEVSYIESLISHNILISEESRVNILTYFNCVNSLLQNEKIYQSALNEGVLFKFYRCMYLYYKRVLDNNRALQYWNKSFSLLLASSNQNDKLLINGEVGQLVEIYRNLEKYSKAKEVLISIGEAKSEYSSPTHFFPVDVRVWKPAHYKRVRLSLKTHFFTINKNQPFDYHVWSYKRLFALNLAKYQASVGNWEMAHNLLLRADSIMNMIMLQQENFAFLIKMSDLFQLSPSVKEQNNVIDKQNLVIINRTNLVIGALIISFILIFLTIVARKQRNKARKATARAEILSFTMYQMGHMAPLCINNVIDKHKKMLEKPIRKTLENLSTLLRKFYDYSLTEITYKQEYELVCEYVDLAFQTPNGELPSDKIEANWNEYPELKLPTYVLFNTIQNAFKHGRISSNISDQSKVSAKIVEKEGKYEASITNPIYGDVKKNIEEKSGMKYIKTILEYWNNKKSNNYKPSITNKIFKFTFVFRSKK